MSGQSDIDVHDANEHSRDPGWNAVIKTEIPRLTP